MLRASIIMATGLLLAACAASEPPPVRWVEDIPVVPAGRPAIIVEPVGEIAGTAERTPSTEPDVAPSAPRAVPRPRFRVVSEQAPMADASERQARRERARFRPITE